MKLSTQLAVVIVAGIAGIVGMVAFLSAAGWSEGGIAGMVTGIFTSVGALVLVVRNQGKQNEVLAGQDEKLETIERNTNGLSAAERQDIANRAARAAIAEAKNRGEL